MATVLNTANTQANISSNIYTNGNNLVTAAMVASVLQNISVSYINRITDYNLLGLKVFSTTTQYQIGDCVVYSGQLYQCTTAHLGAWSAGDFALVGGGGGTVTTVSGVAANGFTWSISNASTAPAITLTLQNATTSQSGQLTSTDWNTFNGKQAALNGTGFVKASGTTISYDNSTYLTTITGIGASGNLGGTYPSPSVIGALGVNYPALPTSGNYQLQAAISAGSVTAWSFVAPGLSNPMTTLYDIIYGGTVTSGVAALTRLAGNTTTTQKFLTGTGTGSAAGVPTWFDLFGTANSWTAQQTITLAQASPFYGAQITNSQSGSVYNQLGAGLKMTSNAINASLWLNNSSGSDFQSNTLQMYSDKGVVIQSGARSGASRDIVFSMLANGSYTNEFRIVTGSSSPYNQALLYNNAGGSSYSEIGVNQAGTNSTLRGYTTKGTFAYSGTDVAAFNATGMYVGGTTAPTSTLQSGGSFAAAYILKTANYSLTSSDYVVVFNGTTLTATLPTASGCANRIYIVANRNATSLTTSAYYNLAGISTTTIATMTSVMMISDGTNWQQIQ